MEEKEYPRPATGAGNTIHTEKIDGTGYKLQRGSIIHTKIISELDKRAEKRNSIIPFPEINRILTWLFHCNKQERERVEGELLELGMVEVVAFHGWKIVKTQNGVK